MKTRLLEYSRISESVGLLTGIGEAPGGVREQLEVRNRAPEAGGRCLSAGARVRAANARHSSRTDRCGPARGLSGCCAHILPSTYSLYARAVVLAIPLHHLTPFTRTPQVIVGWLGRTKDVYPPVRECLHSVQAFDEHAFRSALSPTEVPI